MQKIQNFLLRTNYLKRGIIIIGFVFVFLFSSVDKKINHSITSLFVSAASEKTPDSSIVIISITSNDIEKLGGWPLKRSYYALLVNRLTKLNVKRIGIEVLLSSSIALQSIYNNLLDEEIKESKRVVVSSIIAFVTVIMQRR